VEWPLARLRDMASSFPTRNGSPDGIPHDLARVLTSTADDDRLLTAAEVAHRFGVNRGWVYAHAGELGVVRLAAGPRAPLRFDPATVASYLTGVQQDRDPAAGVVSVRETVSSVPLLPIHHEPRRMRRASGATSDGARA